MYRGCVDWITLAGTNFGSPGVKYITSSRNGAKFEEAPPGQEVMARVLHALMYRWLNGKAGSHDGKMPCLSAEVGINS